MILGTREVSWNHAKVSWTTFSGKHPFHTQTCSRRRPIRQKLPAPRLGASGSEVSVLPEVASDLLLSPFPFPLPGRNPLSDFDHCHYCHRQHLTLDYSWVLSGFHPSAMVAPDDGCGDAAYRCRRPRRLRCGRRFRYPWLQRSSVDLLRRPPCRPVTLFHRIKKTVGAGLIQLML